jgi:hypothetical protein
MTHTDYCLISAAEMLGSEAMCSFNSYLPIGVHAGDVVGSGSLFDGLRQLRLALKREKDQ